MSKIKMTVKDRIIAFDFKVDLLKSDILYEICKALNLSDLYIDIFGINIRNNGFAEKLTEKNRHILISKIKYENDLAIKAKVDDIAIILDVLSDFSFDEMNIWDVYTEWEQYLKDKNTYNPIPKTSEAKVYLNYNRFEGNRVELYLDKNFHAEEILRKLNELVK